MMENREAGCLVLYERIKAARQDLDIKTFRRTPSRPVREKDLLCVFMSEGIDRVIKPVSRNPLGYPARRELEIIFELIHKDDFDLRGFFTRFRRVVLSASQLTDDCFIRELRTIGPQGYKTPGVVGLTMVCGMRYIDNG